MSKVKLGGSSSARTRLLQRLHRHKGTGMQRKREPRRSARQLETAVRDRAVGAARSRQAESALAPPAARPPSHKAAFCRWFCTSPPSDCLPEGIHVDSARHLLASPRLVLFSACLACLCQLSWLAGILLLSTVACALLPSVPLCSPCVVVTSLHHILCPACKPRAPSLLVLRLCLPLQSLCFVCRCGRHAC